MAANSSSGGLVEYRKDKNVNEIEEKYGISSDGKAPGKKGSKKFTPVPNNASSSHVSAGQKKTGSHFIPVENADHGRMKLPGRHPCHCQARRHGLINNCLGCGRIVCEQEGSGPCLFCTHLVCSPDEENILRAGGKKGAELKAKLYGALLTDSDKPIPALSLGSIGQDIEKAIDAKNRLLEFERQSARRTTVIDDQQDYFSVNSPWLTNQERAKLKQRYDALRQERFKPRSQQKMTLDFAGRQVLLESQNVDMYVSQEAAYQPEGRSVDNQYGSGDSHRRKLLIEPQFLEDASSLQTVPSVAGPHSAGVFGNSSRIQDSSLQELRDEGMCLSMHQPWASLLVMGIKQHEGRTWYTAHRGRLWIAAAAKVPTPDDIRQVEQGYRVGLKNDQLRFPEFYPTGCLLGCVEVKDCLAQEQYREQFPDGESFEPYVLICTVPQELRIRFPVQGKHKIWKLEPTIHMAAKKGLGDCG